MFCFISLLSKIGQTVLQVKRIILLIYFYIVILKMFWNYLYYCLILRDADGTEKNLGLFSGRSSCSQSV